MAQDEQEQKRPGELLDRLSAERKRQARIRTVLGGGVFGLFLIFGLSIVHQFRSFDSNRLEVKMNARASAALWPIVSKHLDRLTPQAIPALDAAMLAESGSMLPPFNARLEGESDLYDREMAVQGDRLLDEAMDSAISARGLDLDSLRSALHSDPIEADQAYKALVERAESWARAELDHLLKEERSVLHRLHAQSAALEENQEDLESLQDVLMMFIEIAHTEPVRGG